MDAVRRCGGIKAASVYLPGRFPRRAWNLPPSSALWPAAPSSAAAPPSEAPRCEGERQGGIRHVCVSNGGSKKTRQQI